MPLSLATIVAVALGGSMGALARLAIVHLTHRDGVTHAPWTILWVNLAGCFAIGVLIGYVHGRPPASQTVLGFAAVGVLGSFTTFSAFSADTLRLVQQGRVGAAVVYVCVSVGAGVALSAVGFWAASGALWPGRG